MQPIYNAQTIDEVTMKEIKLLELELLKTFVETCDKMNIPYYVIGGTLLGTVRHKGFIPWDDDIDVALLREDYERWLIEAPKLIDSPNVFLQHYTSDPQFPTNFAKLRNSNTTFIETTVASLEMNHGIYIDIFPLDYYPDRKFQQIMFDLKKRVLTWKVNEIFRVVQGDGFVEKSIWKIKRILSRMFARDAFDAVKKREKLYKRYSNTSLIANHSGAWGKKEIVPAEWYEEREQMTFEGIPVLCPKQWDKWLKNVYGDYMTFPPVEKRVSHHFTDVIDTTNSYINYIEGKKK